MYVDCATNNIMMHVMKPQCSSGSVGSALEGRENDDERCNVM